MTTHTDDRGSTDSVIALIQRDVAEFTRQHGCASTLDVLFLCFLRRMARYGYFTLGPITIDVAMIEEIVERTVVPGDPHPMTDDAVRAPLAREHPDLPATIRVTHLMTDDTVRFSRLVVEEMRRSGRKRLDEMHYLLAFMRCGEGLPGRVFGELGVTADQIERYLKRTGGVESAPPDRLLSPEDVAEYLGVHVQTVRAWIRSGRLPARRIAGLRALRVRFADVENLLQPLDEPEA